MTTNAVNFPCKDCAERTVGCHSRCEKYLAARDEQRQKNDLEWKQRISDIVTDSYKNNVCRKIKERTNRKK